MKKLLNFTKKNIGKKKLFKKPGIDVQKNILIPDSLQKQKLEPKHTRILCTSSGGQDSIVTFFILLHSKKKECLEVLYCQHFWQTKNFFSSRLIFQVSYLFKVPYTLSLPQNLFVTENDSREWRKKNFCRFSKMENALTIVTGHTETDALEKNLNNLLRGTSPAGVSKRLFLTSKKTVGVFFSTSNQNTCLLIKKTRKTDLPQVKTESCIRTNFFKVGTGPGRVSFQKVKNKKISQISLKTNRIYKQKPIIKKHFQFFKPLNTFSQTQIFSFNQFEKKRLGRIIEIQPVPISKTPFFIPAPLDPKINFWLQVEFVVNSKNLVKNKNKIWHRCIKVKERYDETIKFKKKFSFLKTKKSCSFFLSSELCKTKIELTKPLENLSRFSVSKLVDVYKFPLLIDVTNFSSVFSRNKIRHQLFPFIRSLVHSNIEFLLIQFFKMVSEQQKELEKEFQKLDFVSRLFKRKALKLIGYFPNLSIKILINKIYKKTLQFLIQKLFFDYKNISLNYSQIFNLDKFY